MTGGIQWLTGGIQWQYCFSLNTACQLFNILPKNLWNHLRSKTRIIWSKICTKSSNIKDILSYFERKIRFCQSKCKDALDALWFRQKIWLLIVWRTFLKSLQIRPAVFNEKQYCHWKPPVNVKRFSMDIEIPLGYYMEK